MLGTSPKGELGNDADASLNMQYQSQNDKDKSSLSSFKQIFFFNETFSMTRVPVPFEMLAAGKYEISD
jgi:hypothetical protein